MAPVCSRYMDSFPHPNPTGNQMQFCHPWPAMWGNPMPPRMNVEQSESPQGYGAWSYGSNCGYPSSWECHNCCQHGHPPHHSYYGFRPPCNHFPQPQQPMFCYHGPYPPYQEAQPSYNIPVLRYASEQPHYEYDKSGMGSLCAMCLNKCDARDGSGVRIDEHDAEAERKENNAFAPMKFDMNGGYPVVWMPSEYMKNKDNDKEKEKGESKQSEMEPRIRNGQWPSSVKNDRDGNGPSMMEPKEWNGWFPLDLNNIKSVMQDGARRAGDQDQRIDHKDKIPFPLLWLRDSDKRDNGWKKNVEVSNSPKPSEQQPTTFKVISVKQPENKKTMEDSASSKPAELQPVMFKLIPVKQPNNNDSGDEKVVESNVPSSKEKEVKDIPVKRNGTPASQSSEMKEKKALDNKEKRKSPSPPKGSNLPPICLRVDPVPKKKNGNGTSRSPSPPSHKCNVQESSNESSKISNALAEKNVPQLGAKLLEAVEEKQEVVLGRKEIEVAKGKNSQTSAVESRTPQDVTEKQDTSGVETPATVKSKGGQTTVMDDDKPEQDKKEKKSVSEPDAATIVQSAYRGYEVRKWEPMKKLKQIAKVREQANELRKRIETLESSTEGEKERIVLGEMIMNLLLQLDTIQGLHPTVREIRKSVARELVLLQEKLDSMTSRNDEKKQLSGLCETVVKDGNEAASEREHELTAWKEESEQSESMNQLDTSSSTKVVSESMEGDVQSPNKTTELPSTNGDGMRPKVDDGDHAGASAELKNEEAFISSEMENMNKGIGVLQVPATYSTMLEQGADSETKELTGSSGEADTELVGSGPKADDDQQQTPSLSLVDEDKVEDSCEKPDRNQDVNEPSECKQEVTANVESIIGDKLVKNKNMDEELDARLPETNVVKSSVEMLCESSTGVGEPVARLLAGPLQVVDDVEMPLDDNVEQTVTSEEQERENPSENKAFQVNKEALENASKSGEAPLIELVQGETNEERDAGPEHNEGDKKSNLIEPPVEPNGVINAPPVDISDAVNARVPQNVEAMVRKEHESDEEVLLPETEMSGISTPPPSGEARVSSCPCLGLEPIEVSDIEKKERKPFTAATEEAVTAKEELTDLASTSAEATEEKIHAHSTTKEPRQGGTISDEKKLVKVNEKLREMLEKLMEAGMQQITAISELNGRVKDLEKRLSRKKKMRISKPKKDFSANTMSRKSASCAM
ncbi:hypothetical protein Sjap_021042 [Stephania japonica]|uniref:BAG domain-containing protein n=1 Tax=Stephania japonica TaxID=461633 RepID=A0AAP0F724_9MAGN